MCFFCCVKSLQHESKAAWCPITRLWCPHACPQAQLALVILECHIFQLLRFPWESTLRYYKKCCGPEQWLDLSLPYIIFRNPMIKFQTLRSWRGLLRQWCCLHKSSCFIKYVRHLCLVSQPFISFSPLPTPRFWGMLRFPISHFGTHHDTTADCMMLQREWNMQSISATTSRIFSQLWMKKDRWLQSHHKDPC